MAKCAFCDNTIVFGGKRLEGLRFCNKRCLKNGGHLIFAGDIEDDLLRDAVELDRLRPCTYCKKRSPSDVYHSYKLVSLGLSFPLNRAFISCRHCATMKQIESLLVTAAFGWWSIPWGIILTPLYLYRNTVWLFKRRNLSEPSQELIEATRSQLAMQYGNSLMSDVQSLDQSEIE